MAAGPLPLAYCGLTENGRPEKGGPNKNNGRKMRD